MKPEKSVLSNGLTILSVSMPSLTSVTVTVWVKTGSRNEETRTNGISHFLEHMAFKGSKKRPSAKEISELVDSFGGEFNAGTNKDWTNFYIKARSSNLETVFDVLSDMVINPVLSPEEIEREKGTIIQELAMYEDTPMIKIGDVFEEKIFEGNSLGWDIGGTPKTVKNIMKNDFVRYRESHYYPENMLVSVSGGIKHDEVMKLAKKYFIELDKGTKDRHVGKKFVDDQKKYKVNIKNKKSDQAHFIVGFLGDGRTYENRYVQGVLSTILGGGMSSRLFIEVRERRGLAYSVRSLIERYQETGYFAAYVGTDPKKVDESIKIVLDEHYKIAHKSSLITEKELKKAKEYLKGHISLSLEDTQAVGDFFAFQELFQNINLTPNQVFEKIDSVTAEDIYAEAKRIFNPSKLTLGVIGPFKDKTKFEKTVGGSSKGN